MTQDLKVSVPHEPTTSMREIERVWRRRRNSFLRAAYHLANGDPYLAEALVSRTTVRVLEYVRNTEHPIDNIEAFFFVALHNNSLDYWRCRNRENEGLRGLSHVMHVGQGTDETLNRVMARQELGMIASFLSELPPKMQFLALQRFVEHRPYAHIAARMGISETLVRKRVQVLREKLRRHLAPENFASPRHNSVPAASNSIKHSHD